MSLEERTLVVRNIDGDKLTTDLLEELFANFGPVVKIVLRKSFAYVQYSRKVSVAYALAMMEGITLYGNQLRLCPKLESDRYYRKYRNILNNFDESIVHNFLTSDHIKEKSNLISTLKSSNSKFESISKRVLQYSRHFLPNSTYNALLGQDFVNRNSRYYQPSSFSTNRGSNGGSSENRSQNHNHTSEQSQSHHHYQHDDRYQSDLRRTHSYSDLNSYNNNYSYGHDNWNSQPPQRHSTGGSRYHDNNQPQSYSQYDNSYAPPPPPLPPPHHYDRERRHSDYGYNSNDQYPKQQPHCNHNFQLSSFSTNRGSNGGSSENRSQNHNHTSEQSQSYHHYQHDDRYQSDPRRTHSYSDLNSYNNNYSYGHDYWNSQPPQRHSTGGSRYHDNNQPQSYSQYDNSYAPPPPPLPPPHHYDRERRHSDYGYNSNYQYPKQQPHCNHNFQPSSFSTNRGSNGGSSENRSQNHNHTSEQSQSYHHYQHDDRYQSDPRRTHSYSDLNSYNNNYSYGHDYWNS